MSKKTSPIFRTQFSNDTGKFLSNSGSGLLAKYAYKINEDGSKELCPTGEYDNVYERIQADYPSTDINLLIQRFALGETDVLNVREGFYADLTKMPSNYAELFQMNEDAKRYFDSLPTDVKEMFDNSYTEFFASDPKVFAEKIEDYNKRFDLSPEFNVDSVSDIKESEVNDNA